MGADTTLNGIVGTYSNHDFVIRSYNSNKIYLQNPNVGIQTVPSEYIHLSSEPGAGNYLRIDAEKISNDPPQQPVPGAFNFVAGPGTDDAVLGLPDYWMEIKIFNGNIVLIPCYTPAP